LDGSQPSARKNPTPSLRVAVWQAWEIIQS
jgi:hypothetical protein